MESKHFNKKLQNTSDKITILSLEEAEKLDESENIKDWQDPSLILEMKEKGEL